MIAGGDEIGSPLDITGILAAGINLVPTGFISIQGTVPVKAPLPAIPTVPGGLQFGTPIKAPGSLPAPQQPGILQQLIQWYLAHQLDYSKFPIPRDTLDTWIIQFVRSTLDASIQAFKAWITAHTPVDPPVPIGFTPTCSKCQLVSGSLPSGDFQEELI